MPGLLAGWLAGSFWSNSSNSLKEWFISCRYIKKSLELNTIELEIVSGLFKDTLPSKEIV